MVVRAGLIFHVPEEGMFSEIAWSCILSIWPRYLTERREFDLRGSRRYLEVV